MLQQGLAGLGLQQGPRAPYGWAPQGGAGFPKHHRHTRQHDGPRCGRLLLFFVFKKPSLRLATPRCAYVGLLQASLCAAACASCCCLPRPASSSLASHRRCRADRLSFNLPHRRRTRDTSEIAQQALAVMQHQAAGGDGRASFSKTFLTVANPAAARTAGGAPAGAPQPAAALAAAGRRRSNDAPLEPIELRRLFVSNILQSVDEDLLEKAFGVFGSIDDMQVGLGRTVQNGNSSDALHGMRRVHWMRARSCSAGEMLPCFLAVYLCCSSLGGKQSWPPSSILLLLSRHPMPPAFLIACATSGDGGMASTRVFHMLHTLCNFCPVPLLWVLLTAALPPLRRFTLPAADVEHEAAGTRPQDQP